MSFAFLVVAFLAASGRTRPDRRSRLVAAAAAFALVAACALLAEWLLDLLDVSPESFRIAAGLVLALAGLRALVVERVAMAVTPELALLAVAAGADEHVAAVLGAAALGLAAGALAPARAARVLAALQVVVGVALTVSGVQDV